MPFPFEKELFRIMLSPIKRFRSQRTPIIFKYPAPFDNSCLLLVDEDSAVIIWKDDHIYKKIKEHGFFQLTDCPEDAHLYFIYIKEYALAFAVKSDKGDILYDKIVIQISDPEEFLYSVMGSKSIVTGATADIYSIQSVREVISDCHDKVTIEIVNDILKERRTGFRIVNWRCIHEDEDKRIKFR